MIFIECRILIKETNASNIKNDRTKTIGPSGNSFDNTLFIIFDFAKMSNIMKKRKKCVNRHVIASAIALDSIPIHLFL
ncbi:MAG: hypothetical protein A2W93_15390 [Bacteroidetes bacterium GWF2_43_63]|nr:MAG: hypothetical protein A2W93_15390 [Bacteroidetes bacterium GWF2_43_63]